MVVGLNGVFGLLAQPLAVQDRKQELGVSAEVQNQKILPFIGYFLKFFAKVFYLMIILGYIFLYYKSVFGKNSFGHFIIF